MKNKKHPEDNEQLLRQVALTINAKGISKDLKQYLSRKIAHNRNNLHYLSKMVNISGKQDPIEIFQKKSNPLTQLMNHLIKEIKITDMTLDLVLQNLIQREVVITSEMTNNKGNES